MTLKLLSTTAFRLSLIYALLFSLVASIALGVAYWLAAELVRQQTDERLQLETNVLLSQYYSGNFQDLTRMVSQRKNKGPNQFFVYALTHRRQHNFFDDIPQASAPRRSTFTTLPLNVITQHLPVSSQELDTRVLITRLPGGYQLLVGTDLNDQEQLLTHIARVLLTAVAIIITAAMLGGWWMGRSVLSRIDNIHQTSKAIIDGDLSQRMSIDGRETEFNRLAQVINDMLDRIEILLSSMHDVTDNLAHDLRNPLNRLHHRLEAMQHFQPPDNVRKETELSAAIEDVDKLISTFNAILNIAQIKAEVRRDHWEDIDITHMMEELAGLYTVVAEDAGIKLDLYTEHNLHLFADRQLLAQATTNLLDNAIKYTPKGGKIQLKSFLKSEVLTIAVTDSGIGIPSKEYARVFKRFVRLENARNTPGNGLGLSLVKAVMDLHHGQIILNDNQPGLRVELAFSVT
jgi:signal transduction histidine kinase